LALGRHRRRHAAGTSLAIGELCPREERAPCRRARVH
jgi:hypothetical protein